MQDHYAGKFQSSYDPEYEAKTQVDLGETRTVTPKVVFFYMNDFEATRWFLEALKTAGDSCGLPLKDPKMWSTFVDL